MCVLVKARPGRITAAAQLQVRLQCFEVVARYHCARVTSCVCLSKLVLGRCYTQCVELGGPAAPQLHTQFVEPICLRSSASSSRLTQLLTCRRPKHSPCWCCHPFWCRHPQHRLHRKSRLRLHQRWTWIRTAHLAFDHHIVDTVLAAQQLHRFMKNAPYSCTGATCIT